MKIKIIEGHLTAIEKNAIKKILELKLWSGKVGKKNYFITKHDGIFKVTIQVKDRGLIPCPGSQLRISIYTHKFTLKN